MAKLFHVEQLLRWIVPLAMFHVERSVNRLAVPL